MLSVFSFACIIFLVAGLLGIIGFAIFAVPLLCVLRCGMLCSVLWSIWSGRNVTGAFLLAKQGLLIPWLLVFVTQCVGVCRDYILWGDLVVIESS